MKIKNEWVKATTKIWMEIKKKLNMSGSVCSATKINLNPEFVPSMMKGGYYGWEQKGLVYIGQLIKVGDIKTYNQLHNEFNLPMQDFYKYLQIRSYLIKHYEWENIRKPPNRLEEEFMKPNNIKKLISKFYKALQMEPDNNLDIKAKWERERTVEISKENWAESFNEGGNDIKSQVWREFDWKFKSRYFIVPQHVAKFGSMSDECWRGCGQVGDYTHIFWDCPKLSEYWISTYKQTD